MVIDTSALLAILLNEPERRTFIDKIAADDVRYLSAAILVETATVLESRKGPQAQQDLDLFLYKADMEIVLVSVAHADIAHKAYRLYGKGRHLAGLNCADCFAYALAKATGEPWLFKGNDFSQTDIPSC